MRLLVLVLSFISTFAFCEEELGFRIYSPGDTVTVEDDDDEPVTIRVTREWVAQQARVNPEIRYYWRSSPKDVVRVFGTKQREQATEKRSSDEVTSLRGAPSYWENEVSREPKLAERYVPSTSNPPEERTSRWIDGRYVNGRYVPGHMETQTPSGVQKSSSTQVHRYYVPSTGAPVGDTNPNSPRNQETQRYYEQREARAAEKAVTEQLFGKPLTSVPGGRSK